MLYMYWEYIYSYKLYIIYIIYKNFTHTTMNIYIDIDIDISWVQILWCLEDTMYTLVMAGVRNTEGVGVGKGGVEVI